jgi:hypothetical protein
MIGMALQAAGVSMLFVCCAATLSGCKRRQAGGAAAAPVLETVITNRMEDPVYRKALEDNQLEQTRQAAERSVVVDRMKVLIAEARAALPAGTDDETVRAELEKRPEWKMLEEENARMNAGLEKTLAAARETVRRRIEAETQDRKAVAEGRAVPAGSKQPAVGSKQ